jgi:hypothetical protein
MRAYCDAQVSFNLKAVVILVSISFGYHLADTLLFLDSGMDETVEQMPSPSVAHCWVSKSGCARLDLYLVTDVNVEEIAARRRIFNRIFFREETTPKL